MVKVHFFYGYKITFHFSITLLLNLFWLEHSCNSDLGFSFVSVCVCVCVGGRGGGWD